MYCIVLYSYFNMIMKKQLPVMFLHVKVPDHTWVPKIEV